MTLVCVPIMVRDAESAIAEASQAKRLGADMVEFRLDGWFAGSDDPDDAHQINECVELIGDSPLPCIATCRPAWEGGLYDGAEDQRVSLFQALGTSDRPPAYIDVELQAYTASANIRQKINLAVEHPKQRRDVHTRLILSIHDFEGRPPDLTRRLTQAYSEPAGSVVKVAFRARSLRDNLELFEILREAQKPTIALGMGEFGLMSRVLAPKFGGFLTFASLRKEEITAPGQPTIDELLNLYRFRSIGTDTKVYGVIGWPVGHSMSPLIHNAGFAEVGHDGVYLPLPIAADADTRRAGFEDQSDHQSEAVDDPAYASFKATVSSLIDDDSLSFAGASVTIPHKINLRRLGLDEGWIVDLGSNRSGNTLVCADQSLVTDTDSLAVERLLEERLGQLHRKCVCLVGTGGVARSISEELLGSGMDVALVSRDPSRADELAGSLNDDTRSFVVHEINGGTGESGSGGTASALLDALNARADAFINCTPVGMTGGPDPEGLSIPIPEMTNIGPETVFFDTVYNPIETPMLKAARERGCRTIDGVQMFVKQAAAQFELWTGEEAPIELFDRLVREKLSTAE